MPFRPPQHVIGAKAVSAVTDIWVHVDAAVETVTNDYGEDLLVQTSLDGRLDSSRIWVQVKGRTTVRPRKDGSRSVRIPVDTVFRWTASADRVIIVLWDVTARRGWYAYPYEQIDPIETLLSGKSAIEVVFAEEDQFTEEAARMIAWNARIDGIVGRYLRAGSPHELLEIGAKEAAEHAHKMRVFAIWDLLSLIDFWIDGEVNENILRGTRRGYDHDWGIVDGEPPLTPERTFDMALTLMLMAQIEDITGQGLPFSLDGSLSPMATRAILGDRTVEQWSEDCYVDADGQYVDTRVRQP